MLTPSCSAFRFTDDNSCQLYDATYLYKDKTDNPGISVYVQDNLWNQRGKCVNTQDFLRYGIKLQKKYQELIII